MTFQINDRVRYTHERYDTLPDSPADRDFGRVGVVTRTPDMEATEGCGPSGSYAVKFDGSAFPRAPIAPEHLTAP